MRDINVLFKKNFSKKSFKTISYANMRNHDTKYKDVSVM
jgi:hypothetical protein